MVNKGSKAAKKTAQAAQLGGKDQVLPGSVEELLPMAQEACKSGQESKALHLYTMAINSMARSMKIDKDGMASDEDLAACNKSTGGKLGEALAERSHLHLKKNDVPSALEDAETSVRADPKSEFCHLRLLEAYEATKQPLKVCLQLCEQGLESCPDSEVLVAAKWRLKKAIAEQADDDVKDAATAVQETRRAAEDASDPRHISAAADWGSLLATGAHGVTQDVDKAEKYLRIGAEGGDVVARRNLGMLLLELERPTEAAEELNKAANAGDDEAGGVLQQLAGEAADRQKEALAQLEAMASAGDPRARAMLEELRPQLVA